jgi:hypothetical protein
MPIGQARQQLTFAVSGVRRSQRTTRNRLSIEDGREPEPTGCLVAGFVGLIQEDPECGGGAHGQAGVARS